MKQGSKSKALFMIKEGEAAIVRKQKTGFVPLVRLKKGDFFGRLPFLDMGHEPYSSAVFAGEGLEASRMDPDSMQKEYDQLSPILRNLIENIGTTISITTRAACEFQKTGAEKKGPVKKDLKNGKKGP